MSDFREIPAGMLTHVENGENSGTKSGPNICEEIKELTKFGDLGTK